MILRLHYPPCGSSRTRQHSSLPKLARQQKGETVTAHSMTHEEFSDVYLQRGEEADQIQERSVEYMIRSHCLVCKREDDPHVRKEECPTVE